MYPCPVSVAHSAYGYVCDDGYGDEGHYYGFFLPTIRGDMILKVYSGDNTYIHTYIHKCAHTYICSYLLTYMHTYTHTYILTYIHTYIHVLI